MVSGDSSQATGQELLDAIVKSGKELLTKGQQQLARLGDVTDDPRWGAPLPVRYDVQIPVLFLGTLDACDATITMLSARASQQAFHTLRFQIESLALIRWMSEPADAAERQHRAYRLACGQVRRFGRFMMKDAGRDKEALNGVRAVRDWGTRLRQIAKEDGIPDLKVEPSALDLFKSMDVAGYANFSMYSELGSHPGTAGNIFFALTSHSKRISYDLQGALVERGFLAGTSIFYQWKTCESVSAAMGWDAWLQAEVQPVYYAILPLLTESLERRKTPRASES